MSQTHLIVCTAYAVQKNKNVKLVEINVVAEKATPKQFGEFHKALMQQLNAEQTLLRLSRTFNPSIDYSDIHRHTVKKIKKLNGTGAATFEVATRDAGGHLVGKRVYTLSENPTAQ